MLLVERHEDTSPSFEPHLDKHPQDLFLYNVDMDVRHLEAKSLVWLVVECALAK